MWFRLSTSWLLAPAGWSPTTPLRVHRSVQSRGLQHYCAARATTTLAPTTAPNQTMRPSKRRVRSAWLALLPPAVMRDHRSGHGLMIRRPLRV